MNSVYRPGAWLKKTQTWGAPKNHGELQKLGFVLSERSVACYLRGIRRRGDPDNRWLAFLQNHREAIVAFNFFTAPTDRLKIAHCFFVMEHRRRKILHFNVTRHPATEWSSNNCVRLSPALIHTAT
jgi:putative transposase